jgi:competence protein ComEC
MAGLPPSRLAYAPLGVLATGFATGVAVCGFSQSHLNTWVLFSAGLLLPILALTTLIRNQLSVTTALIILSFFIAGFVLSKTNRALKPNEIVRLWEEGTISPAAPVELTGMLDGDPESAPGSLYFTLDVESATVKGAERVVPGKVLLVANAHSKETKAEYDVLTLRHGARIRVMTTLDRDDDFRNPGVRPFTEYLDQKGYDAVGVIKSPLLIERLEDGKVFLLLAWLYEWRTRLDHEFAARFSPETAGLLQAAVLGNRYNISHSAADRFRTGGTFHVLVISGLHIAFVGGLVLLLSRRFTRRRVLQVLFSATFLWAYTFTVGAEAPVVRAAFTFTLVVLAPAVWRRSNALNSLGGAVLALLVWRPDSLFDPSFQLTFASVLSIILIAAPLVQRMERVGSWRPAHSTPYPPMCGRGFRTLSEILFWNERAWRVEILSSSVRYKLFKAPFAATLQRWRLQRPLRFAFVAILVSVSVQIGMLPLLIIYFHRVSFASLILNIFVGVLMAALAFLALAALLISYLSAALAVPLVAITEKIDWVMIHSVDLFTWAGVASTRLPHYSGWKSVIYVVYVAALLFLITAFAFWNPLSLRQSSTSRLKPFSAQKVRVAIVLFAVTLAAIIFHPFSAARGDGKLHVDFLDVGQGDSALVTTSAGTTLLIDGGGRPNLLAENPDEAADAPFARDTRSIGEAVVSEFLWSRGLDSVDYLVPTHADADHIDGLNDVARNFKVRGAIVARTPADDPEFARFAQTMKDTGIPVEIVGAGDILRVNDVEADVLWPRPTVQANAAYANDDGLLLRLRYGDHDLLFAADIERKTEMALLDRGIDLRCDVIKVAHHGSKTSSTDAFIAATRAKLAVISVGRTSMFGHPNKEVVERWRASGAEVITTGAKGTISIVSDGHRLTVSTFVK